MRFVGIAVRGLKNAIGLFPRAISIPIITLFVPAARANDKTGREKWQDVGGRSWQADFSSCFFAFHVADRLSPRRDVTSVCMDFSCE